MSLDPIFQLLRTVPPLKRVSLAACARQTSDRTVIFIYNQSGQFFNPFLAVDETNSQVTTKMSQFLQQPPKNISLISFHYLLPIYSGLKGTVLELAKLSY